jgi:hypothetical protein
MRKTTTTTLSQSISMILKSRSSFPYLFQFHPLNRSNERSPLTTSLLIRYGKVGCIHKHPMMVWTHQLSCCEMPILLSVFSSHLFPSSSSIPRPLAYRHSLPLFHRYCMVILKTCNEVIFFISVIPSELRRFNFTVSWLCDDHIAAGTFVVKDFSTSRYDSPLSMLSKD